MNSKQIQRRKRIRRVSRKQARINRQWSKISKAAIESAGGMCCIRIEGICTGRASGSHHKLPKARGGNEQPIAVPACAPCHRYAHEHEEWAKEHGFTLGRNKAA